MKKPAYPEKLPSRLRSLSTSEKTRKYVIISIKRDIIGIGMVRIRKIHQKKDGFYKLVYM